MKTRNWKPHKSDQVFIAHDPALCEGRPCCVHNPSDHHMRDWPQNYRIDTGVTERICSHGVGHPDPDQTWPKDDPHWIHGCDGCCSPERDIPKDNGTPLRFVLDEPTPPCPEISQELLDNPAFQMLSVGNPTIFSMPIDHILTPPVCLLHATLDVPSEIFEAAGTLSIFFEKEGQREWQFAGIADRRLVTKLQQEKRELWDECVAMRKAIEVAFDALDDADGSSFHIHGDACLTKPAKEQRLKALEQLKPFTNHE